MASPTPLGLDLTERKYEMGSMRLVSDPTPGVWGRPRGTSAGLYRGLPYKPGHAYETNPRHRGGNRGSERRVREAEEDTREAEEDKE